LPQKTKVKILIAGSSLSAFTGLSYVSSSFLKRFAKIGNYEVFYCTITGPTSNAQFFKIWGDDFAEEFKDLQCYDSQSHDEKVFNQFDSVIEYIRPNIVLIVSDIWNCEAIIMSPYRNSFMLVMYTTIEVPTYPEYAMFPTFFDNTLRKSLKNLYNRCDLIIPVTKMGKDALGKLGITNNVSENVYNGLDIEKRCVVKGNKKQVFGDAVNNDDFMFMCVSENSDRKILDRTLLSFKKFLDSVENKSKFKLYLHSNFSEVKGGTDIVSLIINNDLQDNVLLAKNFLDNEFMFTNKLYERYATADCYLALTGGEGFGYGLAESLMHELPVVYINYGGYAEFIKDFGFPVEVQTYINAKNIDVKWGLADIDDAVKQMQYVVNNVGEAKAKSQKGFTWAFNNLSWDIIFPKMLKIVEDTYANIEMPKVFLKQIM
jgi:glycosyltransferase involved in cell wall biosynthesis